MKKKGTELPQSVKTEKRRESVKGLFTGLHTLRKVLADEEYIAHLEELLADCIEGSADYAFDLHKELWKHRQGRPPTEENQSLYDLIEKKDKERKERHEDSNWVQSTKAACWEKYHTLIGWQKHYRNFIDHKNK